MLVGGEAWGLDMADTVLGCDVSADWRSPAAWPTSWDPASPEAGDFVEGGGGIVHRLGADWATRFILCG
jgi:hypothetical protein